VLLSTTGELLKISPPTQLFVEKNVHPRNLWRVVITTWSTRSLLSIICRYLVIVTYDSEHLPGHTETESVVMRTAW